MNVKVKIVHITEKTNANEENMAGVNLMEQSEPIDKEPSHKLFSKYKRSITHNTQTDVQTLTFSVYITRIQCHEV